MLIKELHDFFLTKKPLSDILNQHHSTSQITMPNIQMFFESLSENVKEKMKSPLYGAFAFSWVVFNWKPISIFIFSNKNIYSILEDLKVYNSCLSLIFFPLLSALLIIFTFPLVHVLYSYFLGWVSSQHEEASTYSTHRKEFKKQQRENEKGLLKNQQKVDLAKQDAEKAELERKKIEDDLQAALLKENIVSIDVLKQENARLIEENKWLNEFADRIEDHVKGLKKGEHRVINDRHGALIYGREIS